MFGPLEGYPRSQELCHNCDTKPVFTVKTDFIDRTTLLILRNLLKTKVSPKIPAYRFTRYFLNCLRTVFAKYAFNRASRQSVRTFNQTRVHARLNHQAFSRGTLEACF